MPSCLSGAQQRQFQTIPEGLVARFDNIGRGTDGTPALIAACAFDQYARGSASAAMFIDDTNFIIDEAHLGKRGVVRQ
ncbi:hypothetical protein HC891_12275 [Candidatus Gracilibacteria bacterium]|nr:hypothetical protein [Candidatus Gracilibacteria bacterium]